MFVTIYIVLFRDKKMAANADCLLSVQASVDICLKHKPLVQEVWCYTLSVLLFVQNSTHNCFAFVLNIFCIFFILFTPVLA